jgi:hypothetical protein
MTIRLRQCVAFIVFAFLSSAPPGLRQAGIYAALEPGYWILMTECLPN